ncbi:MAG: SDR family NAD(P)-dependent oxidoreductase, partial [Deltaproteobacteria bacterium]|nr:SDR family NAD(P)-dependent oxidoreductase [Deltaproteobacteria bacterium]
MGDRPDLSGKAAIVTGAGKGIGRAIALGLAECGAKVVLAARTTSEIDAVADEIKSRGFEALARTTDLMQTEQIDALVEAAAGAFGGIDILVNNAARSFLRP